MCGIIGVCFLSLNEKLGEIIYHGLIRLEYRGYDSAGIAVIDEHGIRVAKGKGKLKELNDRLGFTGFSGSVGIGHTRWATHGPPTDENAHPHTDCGGVFAVVHNGIIENYYELKQELMSRGHVFKSDTDTEVIPHLVEELYKVHGDVYTAFKEAVKMLGGTYAVLMISTLEPRKVFFAKKDSPLVIGLSNGYTIIASDIPALLDHTRRVIVLRDYWIGYVTPREIYIEDLKTGCKVDHERYVKVIEWSLEDASKEGYEHFMLKEIHEQPLALANTTSGLKSDKSVKTVAELLNNARIIYITGAGTSYHAAEFFALAGQFLLKKPIVPLIASESASYVWSAGEHDLLIAVSQSGETMDVLKAVRIFKKRGVRVVALSNIVDSAIPRESDIALYTRAGPEIGVAATKTFTSQVLALLWLLCETLVVTGSRDQAMEIVRFLEKAPQIVRESIDATENATKQLAKNLVGAKSMYYLSRGVGIPVAREGALKIKEVAYIHAEAYPAGESKHGPIALVEQGFPVVFVVPPNPVLEALLAGNVEEMKARGAVTIGIVHRDSSLKELFHYVVEVPETHTIVSPLALIPPLQLLAYYTAVMKGLDPDKPRNLAKTVTVH